MKEIMDDLDPEFGYHGADPNGALLTRSISGVIAGSEYTPVSGGEGQSITAAIKQAFGDWAGKIKCALYYASDKTLVANGVTEERTIDLTDTATWYVFNFLGTKPTIVNGTAYIIVAWAEPPIDSVRAMLVADYQDDPIIGWDHSHAYNGFPSPVTLVGNADRIYIYCAYGAVAGWTGKISGVTDPAKIMGVDVANIAKVKGVA